MSVGKDDGMLENKALISVLIRIISIVGLSFVSWVFLSTHIDGFGFFDGVGLSVLVITISDVHKWNLIDE